MSATQDKGAQQVRRSVGGRGKAALLVPDALWTFIMTLIPPERPKPKGGRRPAPYDAALNGLASTELVEFR